MSSAPSIFQRTMESLLQGIPKVIVYIDDILITGSTNKEHIETLEKVLSQLKEAGIHLKRDKCFFLQSQLYIWDTKLILKMVFIL